MAVTPRPDLSAHQRRPHLYRPDLIALLCLGLMTAIVCWHRFTLDNWLSRHDLLSFFLPWYGYLGDRLSQFQIPAWNPYLFSGAPFAGDPESGWMYLPAMITFPFFELTVAFKLYILVQLIIAGASSYGLGRVLGFGVWGAMLAATIYEFGPFLYGQTDCCTVGAQVETWIPLALLGVELAFRARSWSSRIAWWFVTGLAISQILLAWLGQGAFNGMLIVGAWVFYRGMIAPPVGGVSWKGRLRATFSTGPAVVLIGLAIGAAGILPKLAFNAASTNPGGTYEGLPGAGNSPFATVYSLTRNLFYDGYAYQGSAIGGVAIVMALVAIAASGRRFATPFFAGATAVIFMLILGTQPVLWLFELIPGFAHIHVHSPGRLIWLQMFGSSMLAGSALGGLLNRRGDRYLIPLAILPMFLVLIVGEWFKTKDLWMGWPVYIGAGVATVCAVVILIVPREGRIGSNITTRSWEIVARSAAAAIIAMAFILPAGKNIFDSVFDHETSSTQELMWNTDPVTQEAIDRNLSRTDDGTAAEFLQEQQLGTQPFRYVGYGGNRYDPSNAYTYPDHRLYPETMAIMTNGRPFRLGLEQTQGYNPLQLKVYADFITALNGQAQNYHYLDLMATGAQSPLLDMLNVRYIVVAKAIPADRADVALMAQGRTKVYEDSEVIVYENPRAYDRAWIVHDVRPDEDGMGLAGLAAGTIDGRRIAFVDGTPTIPTIAVGNVATSDSAIVTSYAPENITIRAYSDTPGFLVLSEIYDKGWKATVNGKDVEVYRTNGALRGIEIPAGESTVVFRYDPIELKLGLFITGAATITMLVSFAAAGWYWVRRPSPGTH